MKRVIGKLNTLTSDGRMIKTLHEPTEPIPVRWRPYENDNPRLIGSATWGLEGDDIVAEISLLTDRVEWWGEPHYRTMAVEDLTPHMEINAPEHHQEGDTWVVDVGILKAIFLDDQPDAFGDLNG